MRNALRKTASHGPSRPAGSWPMAPKVAAAARLSRRRPARDRERGATLVEFAFVFLAFVLLTVGLMELGRGVWTYTTLAHACRQGARFAMVHGGYNPVKDAQDNNITEAAVEEAVKANVIGLDPSKITVITTWTPDHKRGSQIDIQVTYPFEVVTGSLILPQGTLHLRARCRMIVVN